MKKRLFLVAAAALAPGLAVLAFNELSYRAEREQEVHRQALQASRQVASEIGQIVEGVHGLLNAVAAIPAVQQQDVALCRDALKAVASSMAPIGLILLLDTDGKIICDSNDPATVWDLADRGYFKDAVATPRLVIGDYTKSRLSGAGILPIAKAIRNADGSPRAVLATGIRLDWLGEQLRERGLPSGGAVTIADRNGVILARQPLPGNFVGTRIPDAFRHLVQAKAAGTLELRSQDGQTRIMGYQPATLANGLYISAGISKAEAFASVDRASLIGAALVSAGALFAFAAAWFVGNAFIRRPVRRIVDVLERWRAGTPDARTGMKAAQGELESVGESLDALLDELAKRQQETTDAETLRDLTMRELSHRVKNTLTIVQAFARQSFGPHVDRERSRAFNDRIAALAETYDVLLSNEQSAGDMEAVLASALKPHDGVESRIRLAGPSVTLGPQAVLALSMVVHELATNAVKYGALSSEDGFVTIHWRLEPGASARLTLNWREHDGPAVSPPSSEGFGSQLVRRAFPPELDPAIEIAYAHDGLTCELSFTCRQPRSQAA